MIDIERMYPLTLGSNIGTTTTAILAALASDSDVLYLTLQVALAHFFFNMSGILLYYPVPFTRFPIAGSKFLGNTTAQYRWFAVLYLLTVFFIITAVGLTIGGVNTMQKKCPQYLPKFMRTWEFLPLPLRSLAPYDKFFTKYLLCCCSQMKQDQMAQSDAEAIE